VTVANTALLGYSQGMFTAGEATSVLTLRQALAGTATMVLSGQMSVGAAVTLVFKKAVQALNAAFLANPIVLVIALIAALIATIVQAVTRTNAEAEAARAEADALVAKQDELAQAAAQSAVEYEKSAAAIKANTEEAHSMINELEELRNKTERTDEEQQRMAAITATLTGNYSGLSAMVDENTGVLIGNADAWKQVIDAQAGYDETLLALNRANELAKEATEAQNALAAAEAKVSSNQDKIRDNQVEINRLGAQSDEVYAKLTSGMNLTAGEAAALQQEYDYLIGEADRLSRANNGLKDANKTLEKGMGDLSDEADRLRMEEAAAAELAKAKADVLMASYEQQIRAIDEYSAAHGEMTAEEIAQIQALIDAGAEMSDEELLKFNRIKLGREDYIQAIKDGNVEISEAEGAALEERRVNGEELTEIEQAKLERWKEIAEEYKQSVSDTADDIINSWERLPNEYDLTLDEMIEIGEENAERYAEWSQKMVYLSQYMSEESIAQLQQLGPGAMSVIDELIAGGSEKMTEFDNMMIGKVQGTADESVNGFTIITPAVIETFNQLNAGVGMKMDELGNILDTKTGETIASASQIFSGNELPDAARDALDRTGREISNSNVPTQAAKKSAETATKAGKVVWTSTEYTGSGSKAQTEIAKGVSSNNAPVQAARNKAQEATQAAKAEFQKNDFLDAAKQAFSEMARRLTADNSLITAVKNAVTSAASAAKISGWADIGGSMVTGMAEGVRGKASVLTAAIRDVVNAAIKQAKVTAEIKSPSRVFERQVGYMLPAGIAAGVQHGQPVAVEGVEKMMQAVVRAGNASVPMGMRTGATGMTDAMVVNNFNQKNTIVNPPETPGVVYKQLYRNGRRLIREFG